LIGFVLLCNTKHETALDIHNGRIVYICLVSFFVQVWILFFTRILKVRRPNLTIRVLCSTNHTTPGIC